MVSICQQLLTDEELETAVRAGDVYAALVDYFFKRREWEQCYSLVTRYLVGRRSQSYIYCLALGGSSGELQIRNLSKAAGEHRQRKIFSQTRNRGILYIKY